jgi:hypothetical protein
MATTVQTNTFKVDLFNGGHNFSLSGGLAYKMLLIKPSPSGAYDKTLANVGTPGSGAPSVTNVGTDEVSGSGYTTGGFALTNVSAALYTDTAVVTFSANPVWNPSTLSAIAGVIYTTDSTKGTAGRTVAVFDFGGTQTDSNGSFTVNLPTAAAATGLIRSL